MPQQSYVIIDGIRRAKAAHLAGHETIWAQVEAQPEQRIRIDQLLSPNRHIYVRQPGELQRWINVKEGMAEEADLFKPIIVRPGMQGVPVRDVTVIG